MSFLANLMGDRYNLLKDVKAAITSDEYVALRKSVSKKKWKELWPDYDSNMEMIDDIEDYLRTLNPDFSVSGMQRDRIAIGKGRPKAVDVYDINVCWNGIAVMDVVYDYRQNNWYMHDFWYKIEIVKMGMCVYPEVHFENSSHYDEAKRYSNDEIKDEIQNRMKHIEGFITAQHEVEEYNKMIVKMTEIKCSRFDTSKRVYDCE